MKKIALILLALCSVSEIVKSQNEVDALRYSRTTFGGTSRYMAMGGAFGALGADFSTLSSNPAGIGLYKKSEFTFTPSLYFGKTISEYNGFKADDSKTNFNVSNVGMIFSTEPNSNKKSILKNLQFGIGLNRINNFNNRMLIQGTNNENSIVDTYVDNANGINYQDIEDDPYGDYAFDLNLAWYDYLIDTLQGSSDQFRGAVTQGKNKFQHKEINSWGSMNEFLFAFGANFSDRLYVGAAFAFPYIRYFEESLYSEEDNQNLMNDFRRMNLYQDLHTRGTGFNMKFGVIFRATDWVRIGGAIHSPTWFNSMRDYWYTNLTAEFDNNDYFSKRSPDGNYEYEMETPWRAMGNIAFIIGKIAVISADYEYVDYSRAELKGYDYGFYNENAAIKSKYEKSQNIRVGGEYKLGQLAFRAGYSFYGSPFVSGVNDGKKNYYTGGLGYRDKNFFVDLAYVYSSSKEDYYLYRSENVQVNPVKNKYITNNVLLTIGLRY
jgi:hypothetical protein